MPTSEITSLPFHGVYPQWIFSALSFTGFFICLIPLKWHLRLKSVSLALYTIWAGVGCLMWFANSVIWRKDAVDHAPIWCDISTRIIIGLNVALPAAALCIHRQVYRITRLDVHKSSFQHQELIIDLGIGLGIPFLHMALYYINQGHRFDIFEEVGCFPTIYNTPVAYPLIDAWPIVIGLVSAIYCVLSAKQMYQRVRTSKPITEAMKPYYRLFALATVEILGTVPLGIYVMVLNIRSGVNPWISWEDTHSNFSRIGQFPSVQWRLDENAVTAIELTRWSAVGCALLYFIIFGLNVQARAEYCRACAWVAERFGHDLAWAKWAGSIDKSARIAPASSLKPLVLTTVQPFKSSQLSFGSMAAALKSSLSGSTTSGGQTGTDHPSIGRTASTASTHSLPSSSSSVQQQDLKSTLQIPQPVHTSSIGRLSTVSSQYGIWVRPPTPSPSVRALIIPPDHDAECPKSPRGYDIV